MRSFCKAARRGTPAAAWRAHRQILPDGPVLLPTQGLPAWQRTTVLSKGTISWLAQQARTFAAAAGLIDVPCPDFGAESVTEGTLMEWQKNVGDFVAKGELLASIETDKVTVDLTAPESGIVRELLLPNDSTAVKGSILLRLEPSAGSGAAAAAPASSPAAPSAKSTPSPTAPAAAGELKGIRAGFAHAAMLRAQRSGKAPPAAPATAPAPKAAPATAPAPSTAPTPMEIPSTGRGERRVPITPPRRQVISVLKESQNTAASLTTFQECDVGFAQDICKKHEDAFQKTYGAPLGLLSLFVKACSGALAEVPSVNGIIDEQTIRYRDYVDIGVPIPTPRGFVTCVLRNAETMSVPAIEQSIAAFREKARKDELSIADIEGGTFSIFDSGSSGGMLGTPIISPGMSACLGTNVVKKRPVAAAGKVVARPMMFLALTYDHRLIDGREAVTFLCSIRDKIEDPTRLLVGI